jgi:hypothetical protein
MKNKLFLSLILICLVQFISAQKYITKNGHIWFSSHTPMEDIEAHNQQVVSSLDISTGEMAFVLLIKSFIFKRALMQEHFNENYMESDKIPKANFKGKVTNIDKIDFKKDGTYTADVSGDLTIHGVTKAFTTKGTFIVKGLDITGKATFLLVPQDFGIKIYAIVENKIAKQITVNVELQYGSNN